VSEIDDPVDLRSAEPSIIFSGDVTILHSISPMRSYFLVVPKLLGIIASNSFSLGILLGIFNM